MMRYKATLKCKILPDHPDRNKIAGGWDKDKIYEFSDIYTFDPDRWCEATREERNSYMKRDLALVAGGGYNADNIDIISFDVTPVIDEDTVAKARG